MTIQQVFHFRQMLNKFLDEAKICQILYPQEEWLAWKQNPVLVQVRYWHNQSFKPHRSDL